MVSLPDRQIEMLRALEALPRTNLSEWGTPLAMGGTDGSHHSATLRALVKKGLAEKDTRHYTCCRPSYRYRLTPAGRAALEALR